MGPLRDVLKLFFLDSSSLFTHAFVSNAYRLCISRCQTVLLWLRIPASCPSLGSPPHAVAPMRCMCFSPGCVHYQELRIPALAVAHDLVKKGGKNIAMYTRICSEGAGLLGAQRAYDEAWASEAATNASAELKVIEKDLSTATSTQSKYHTHVTQQFAVRKSAWEIAHFKPAY